MRMIATLTSIAALAVGSAANGASRTDWTPVATPAGITMEVLGKGQGVDLGKTTASVVLREEIAFADPRGMTLYTFEGDPAGKSTCVEDCAKAWPPALAPVSARPFGPWSTVKRSNGSLQWAYQGKPLYTSARDVDPGSVYGDSPLRFGARRRNGAGQMVGGGIRGAGAKDAAPIDPLPEAWNVALAYPMNETPVPPDIAIKEVPDALGFVLVNHKGRTLYAFDGDTAAAREACGLTCAWEPVAAPQLAIPIGDFAPVMREDGVKQWNYRGRGLYTFTRDFAEGDANGMGVDARWDVAAVLTFWRPDDVSVVKTPGQGKVLTTASGQTLYRRDGYIFQSGGGHSLRRGQPARPAVGRDIGLNARCENACAKVWHPFAAPSDAQPNGFWNVAQRPDGTKQWVYQGYALWTFDGDKKPGDINGHDEFTTAFADEAGTPKTAARKEMIEIGTPMDGAPGLYWAIAVP
jgi:predicted lipoprotein with Yx(FWY)xxD motif